MDNHNILEIDGVELSFGAHRVLSGVYLKSETGRITGILGRNGCGKSCLLKLIFGELSAEQKSIRINGQRLPESSRRSEDLHMLPQFNFLPRRLDVSTVFKKFHVDFTEFCYFFPELENIEDQKIKELSGGTVRLVETFLILKSPGKFCILDEPFSHLSPNNTDIFIRLIKQEKRNKGIILTDHLHRYITEISDDLYIMAEGTTHKVINLDQLRGYGYLK